MDKLKTIPDQEASNALYLGLGIHKGIETTVEEGVNEYQSHFYVLTDGIINWSLQLEYWIPRVKEILNPNGRHEVEVKDNEFIGYIDYLYGDTLCDFKFSNNVGNYLKSDQLSIYKYYLERKYPEIKINHLKFIFIPKCNFRQKKFETVAQFRSRLYAEMDKLEIQVVEVPFLSESIALFKLQCKEIKSAKTFTKNQGKLCDWCEFKSYCEKGHDWMIL